MDNEKNEILFEIKDEGSLISKIIELLVIAIVITFMFYMGANLHDTGLYSFRSAILLAIVAIISFILFLIFFYKKRKILFYKDKVVLYAGHMNKRNIKIIDIEEIYKILPYHLFSNNGSRLNEKIKRWDILRKFLFIIIFPILIVISILSYIGDIVFYRNFNLKRYRLIIIGRTDKDFLIINYIGDNQEKIEEYFKSSLNIDLQELKPNYWFFIPKKTKKDKK